MVPDAGAGRVVLFRLVLLGGMLLALEAASFATLRYLDVSGVDEADRHVFSATRGHELNPRYRRPFDTDGRFIHSPDGFRRDAALPLEKKPGTFRIFALGASALYGAGVQETHTYPKHRSLLNDETITHFLEQAVNAELAKRGATVRVEVVNAGVNAYHTFHYLIAYLDRVVDYRPDMLVFYDGSNSFYSLSVQNPLRSYAYASTGLPESVNRRSALATLWIGLRFLGRVSQTARLLERLALRAWINSDPRGASPPPRKKYPSELRGDALSAAMEDVGRDAHLMVYDQFLALGRYHGFAIQVFLQPEAIFEDRARLSEHDRNIQDVTRRLLGAEVVDKRQAMRPLFASVFAKYRIPFEDVSSIATDATREKKLYMDYAHLMPEGAKAVAEKMAPAVMRAVLAAPPR